MPTEIGGSSSIVAAVSASELSAFSVPTFALQAAEARFTFCARGSH